MFYKGRQVSSFGCFVFEFWVLRASVFVFECPFRGSYVREFKLSHSNSISRIIKITHADNLHVKVLDFFAFYNSYAK